MSFHLKCLRLWCRVTNDAFSGDNGYMCASDSWMDEWCYQAVVSPEYVSAEIRKILDTKPKVLPLWDPMGALA